MTQLAKELYTLLWPPQLSAQQLHGKLNVSMHLHTATLPHARERLLHSSVLNTQPTHQGSQQHLAKIGWSLLAWNECREVAPECACTCRGRAAPGTITFPCVCVCWYTDWLTGRTHSNAKSASHKKLNMLRAMGLPVNVTMWLEGGLKTIKVSPTTVVNHKGATHLKKPSIAICAPKIQTLNPKPLTLNRKP